MKLRIAENIHCIGAGGIGLSALAKYLVAQGKKVTGSDLDETPITAELSALGVEMGYGQAGPLPAGTDLVIYSEAAQFENPERVTAREKGLTEMSYAEALGAISKDKRTIAISGSNGKSTTTSMIGLILEAAGLDPTVIVGSRVPGFPLGNIRIGTSDWLVVEADDYHAHLLHLRPEVIVLTNIEEEHLDYFADLAHITRTFQAFIDTLPDDGTLVVNADDQVSFDDLKLPPNAITYGIDEPADNVARGLTVAEGAQRFGLFHGETKTGEIELKVPGKFNVSNALAAIACAQALGIPFETIAETLGNFHGIWRRFERVGAWEGAEVVSDYGHHPTAIRGTIAAAREFYPDRRLVLVYQPHQRHRTRALFTDFVASFDGADLVILSDIYDVAGREDAGETVSSAELASAISSRTESPRLILGGDLRHTEDVVKANAAKGDIIVVMGAGNIDSIARNLVQTS